MPGTVAPGIRMRRRAAWGSSGFGGSTASIAMPSGSFSARVNPGSLEYSVRRLSLGEMISSRACWRRSARFTAALRKLASESVAEARRTLSRPAEIAGKEMPAIRPTIATTIIISTRVTPRVGGRGPGAWGRGKAAFFPWPLTPEPWPLFLLALPTDNVGIQPFAAGLSVGAQADDIRLVAVLTRILVHVVVAPRILGDLLRH